MHHRELDPGLTIRLLAWRLAWGLLPGRPVLAIRLNGGKHSELGGVYELRSHDGIPHREFHLDALAGLYILRQVEGQVCAAVGEVRSYEIQKRHALPVDNAGE